jgi:hypothetical protein
VDGLLTAVSAGLAKSLQASFYSAVGLKGGQLTAELSAGAVRSMDFSLRTLGKQAIDGAVRGAIDGALSGAIGEVVFTAADEANWRKGIWDTLSTFGMALMRGAAMGAAGGAVAGGMVEGVGFAGKKMRGGGYELEEAAILHGKNAREELDELSSLPEESVANQGDQIVSTGGSSIDSSPVAKSIRTHERYIKLSKKYKKRLVAEMDSNVAFKTAIENNPELIFAWKNVAHLWHYRNEEGFLKAFLHVLKNKRMQHHIFEGDFSIATSGRNAGNARATGMHHNAGVKSKRMRIDPETKQHGVEYPETYKADVELRNEKNGKWVPKSNNQGQTSFFPDIWSKGQTLEEISFAYWKILENKSSALVEGNHYRYISSSGQAEIRMYLRADDTIISSFPIVK